MTYRSEEGALAAELAQLEAERAELEAEVRGVEQELGRRRAARRQRALRIVAVLGCLLAAGIAGVRYLAHQRAARQQKHDLAALESEIESLEQRVDQLGRVRRIAELGPPLLGTFATFGTPHDPALFAAIRAADPAKTDDAWWIVAHAACRLPNAEQEKSRAHAELSAERRKQVEAFCQKDAEAP